MSLLADLARMIHVAEQYEQMLRLPENRAYYIGKSVAVREVAEALEIDLSELDDEVARQKGET